MRQRFRWLVRQTAIAHRRWPFPASQAQKKGQPEGQPYAYLGCRPIARVSEGGQSANFPLPLPDEETGPHLCRAGELHGQQADR